MPGQSARRHTLSFWWLTYSIHSLPEGEAQACSIFLRLENAFEHILITCIYEFALTRGFIPQDFYWKSLLAYETDRTGADYTADAERYDRMIERREAEIVAEKKQIEKLQNPRP